MKIWAMVALAILICSTATPSRGGAPPDDGEFTSFSMRWENDTFGGTDENYTNGLSLAIGQNDGGLFGGVWDLVSATGGKRFAVYDLAQLQFTPSNLTLSNPNPLDRPYAGLLYLGFATFLQRDDSLHGLKLFAGVVGPASLSEAVQRATHHALGATVPRGWDHQVKNEPIINLLYEYRHRFPLTSRDAPFGVEVIPIGGAMLGNYLTQAQAEVQLRIGYHLPDDFGVTMLRGLGYVPFPLDDRTHHAWGIYAFAGGGATLVVRNITLDGNTFAHSRSVRKRPVLPAAEFGATLWTRYFQASFAYVMWGKEFYGQRVREDFGSLLLSSYF